MSRGLARRTFSVRAHLQHPFGYDSAGVAVNCFRRCLLLNLANPLAVDGFGEGRRQSNSNRLDRSRNKIYLLISSIMNPPRYCQWRQLAEHVDSIAQKKKTQRDGVVPQTQKFVAGSHVIESRRFEEKYFRITTVIGVVKTNFCLAFDCVYDGVYAGII